MIGQPAINHRGALIPNAFHRQKKPLSTYHSCVQIIAPGFGSVLPPASTADVAASALLRTVVVNTGKAKTPGGNGTAAAFAISGAMVAESVAATFGLPPSQVRTRWRGIPNQLMMQPGILQSTFTLDLCLAGSTWVLHGYVGEDALRNANFPMTRSSLGWMGV